MDQKLVRYLDVYQECLLSTGDTLVTQPMLQRRPSQTELRLMDSYIQILCTFQKCKQKVPPPSLLSNEKSPFNFLLTFLEST